MDTLFGDTGYDTSAAWEIGDRESVERRIASILPLGESWSESLARWGNDKTDDIALLAENGRVLSLSIRFDMRRPNLPMFGNVVSAARDLHLALLDVGRKRIVSPDTHALLCAARASRAARYAKADKQHNNRWRRP